MIYTCNDCGFVFYRAGTVSTCPKCDAVSIREAIEAERDIYREMNGKHPAENSLPSGG